jgi:hypothetical protein
LPGALFVFLCAERRRRSFLEARGFEISLQCLNRKKYQVATESQLLLVVGRLARSYADGGEMEYADETIARYFE